MSWIFNIHFYLFSEPLYMDGHGSALIQDYIEIISPLAMDKSISISYKYPCDIFAEIDLERIEQVLVNLLENVIKISDEKTSGYNLKCSQF